MRTKGVLALLVAVSAVGLAASQAYGATTWTVDKTTGTNNCAGNICKTIAKAVQKAKAGDTIVVNAGTYSENVTVDKKLTIKAKKQAPDLLSCDDDRTDPDDTKFAVLDGGGGGIGFDIMAATVTIDGFIIQNYDIGIQTSSTFAGYTIKNNLLQDNLTSGVELDSSGTTTVTTNCFRNNGNGSTTLDLLKSASIKQNHFFQNVVDVNLFPSALNGVATTAVGQNQSKESGEFLAAAATKTLSVSGNIVSGTTTDTDPFAGSLVFAGSNTGLTVSGNIVKGSAANGISVYVDGNPPFDLGNSGTFSSNIVSDNVGDGFYVADGLSVAALTKSTVSSNIFKDNGDDGTHVEKQSVAITTAQKNTFTANINSNNPVHDCHDSNNKDVWTGNTNLGKRVNKIGLCFPGSTVTGPQSHLPF